MRGPFEGVVTKAPAPSVRLIAACRQTLEECPGILNVSAYSNRGYARRAWSASGGRDLDEG